MRAVLVAVAALGLAPVPSPAAVIASERGHQVARHLGTVLWSERDRAGRYHLVSPQGRLPVATQSRPFDVDLGTDARGRVAAVYSRCREGRRLCRIQLYDVAARRETTLFPGHRPALRQGIVAYARLRSDGRDAIVIRRLGLRGRIRGIAVLPRSTPVATGVDIGAGGVAFSAAGNGTRIWFKAPRSRRIRLVAAGTYGPSDQEVHTSPSFAGPYLYWAFANRHPRRRPNGWVIRRDLRSESTLATRAPGFLESVAADAARPSRRLVASTFAGSPARGRPGADQVLTLARPSWIPPPRALGVRR